MGGSHSNTANINQSFMNNITTQNQENCVANANVQVSGNVIIVSGSTVSGSVGTITGVSTDASCLMVSEMENSIQDIMKATSTQTNSTTSDIFGDFQWTNDQNTFNLTQSVTNNISQISESTCTANSMETNSNNYIYVQGSSIGGNVGVASTTNASANCSMSNMMKNYTYNYVQGDNNQGNTQKGMFVAIVGAICTLIGIIIIGVVLLFAVGAIGFTGYELVRPKTPAVVGDGNGDGTDISSELSSLGLSSSDITSLDSQISGATPTIPTIGNIRPIVPVGAGVGVGPRAVPVQVQGVGRAAVPGQRPTSPIGQARPANTGPVAAGNAFLASTGQKISDKASGVESRLAQKASGFESKLTAKASGLESRLTAKASQAGSSFEKRAEQFASRSIKKAA